MAGLTSLWMGDIHANMDEKFITDSFRSMGEDVLGVRIMRNKYNGQPLGYCFVHFPDEKSANNALNMCHGKVIPGSNPPIRYKLNHASGKGIGFATTSTSSGDKEYVLWVGDLSSDVDDAALYKAFSARYTSVKMVRVIKDEGTVSRGYAFVRFGSEDEHKDALAQMHGYRGLGSRPIKVGLGMPRGTNTDAKAKSPGGTTTTTTTVATDPTTDTIYSNYIAAQNWAASYQNYQSYYQGYYQGYDGSYGYTNQDYNMDETQVATEQQPDQTQEQQQPLPAAADEYYSYNMYNDEKDTVENKEWDYSAYDASYAAYYYDQSYSMFHYVGYTALIETPQSLVDQHEDYDDTHLIDYDVPLDVESVNRELLERSELWDAMDSSRWLPSESFEVIGPALAS